MVHFWGFLGKSFMCELCALGKQEFSFIHQVSYMCVWVLKAIFSNLKLSLQRCLWYKVSLLHPWCTNILFFQNMAFPSDLSFVCLCFLRLCTKDQGPNPYQPHIYDSYYYSQYLLVLDPRLQHFPGTEVISWLFLKFLALLWVSPCTSISSSLVFTSYLSFLVFCGPCVKKSLNFTGDCLFSSVVSLSCLP